MKILIFFVSLCLSVAPFFYLFDNFIINLVLIIQSSILLYYIVTFLIFYIKILIDSKRFYKINLNDIDKFKYYREIIKDYSIGELGYIYNGRKKTKLLVLSELQYLKFQKNIYIDNEGIKIINSDNLRKSEKYILEHYKFINDKEFKKRYLQCIESSLKEKKIIIPFKIHINSKMLISFFMMLISFFVSWFLMFNYIETLNNETLYIVIELSLFILTWIVSLVSIFWFDKEHILVKTTEGKEIYMKLNGLKNYIKDFSNFEEKSLNEIYLWEEYSLYAIVLGESNMIEKDAEKELNKIIKVLYNKQF